MRRASAQCFAACANCAMSSNAAGHALDVLSMGMSADFEAAIAEARDSRTHRYRDLRCAPRFHQGKPDATASNRIHRAPANMGARPDRRWLTRNGVDPARLVVADPSDEQLQVARSQFGVRVAADNRAAVHDAGVVIVAVKPQVMRDTMSMLADDSGGTAPVGDFGCRRDSHPGDRDLAQWPRTDRQNHAQSAGSAWMWRDRTLRIQSRRR